MSYLNASPLNSRHKKKFHGELEEVVTATDTPLAGKHFLVLDDELLIALDIQQILETAGATNVICVSNAADALAALRGRTHIDLAVLDVVLSGATRTCMPVAVALAALNIPFVFLTGMSGENLHTERFPQVPVVEKPYQAPLLLAAVARALGMI